LLMLESGCVTSEQLARSIVTAPNLQHQPNPAQWTESWLKAFSGGTNRFLSFSVPVGPPAAILSAQELPLADYGLTFVSSVERQPHARPVFWLKAVPRTNSPIERVVERGTIVVLHGYTCQKEMMIPWGFLLAQAGYRVVLVDLRGHGQSTGPTFSCGKYETKDMIQLLDYLEGQKLCRGPVGVLGLSFGADLGLYWAERDPRIRTVVAIAPFDQPEQAVLRLSKEMKLRVSRGVVHRALNLAGARLGLDWTEWSGASAARRLKQPILLIGGEGDTISRPEDIESLKRAAPPGTRSLMIPEANHFVIGFWFQEIGKPVQDWFQEHLQAETLREPQRAEIKGYPTSKQP
jgi:pimeloyl-ACP methyl ester carboxylesterase